MPRRSTEKRRSTARTRRISKALKKYWARVHSIRKREPDLTWSGARARDRETIQDTIAKGRERAQKSWLLVDEKRRRWKEIDSKARRRAEAAYEAGKISRRKFLTEIEQAVKGRSRSQEFVKRSRAQLSRWELIYRTARRFNLPVREAERFLKRMREEGQKAENRWYLTRGRKKPKKWRTRDAAYVAEWTDRYENVRLEFGL